MEEYLLAKRKEIQYQLEYRWINGTGKDISDLLRGKLEAIDMVLDMKNIFTNIDKVKKQLAEIEAKIKEGAK